MRLLLIFTLISILNSQCAIAAKIKTINVQNIDGVPKHVVYLAGDIVKGDLKKLRKLLTDSPYTGDGAYASLRLNSRGGSYPEALRIAQFILDSSISTVIAERDECYSACAIIFMAGNYFGGNAQIAQLDRTLHIKGKLGFHAPYLKLKQGNYDNKSVEQAHMLAVQAIGKLIRMSNSAKQHRVTVVKSALLAEMLAHGPSELFLIDTVDKAARFEITLSGFKKPARLTRAMFNQICDNALAWKVDQDSTNYDYTDKGSWDGIQSIDKMVIKNKYPVLEGFPQEEYKKEPRGFRVVVKFGPGVGGSCHIDVDEDLNLLSLNTFIGDSPSVLAFPGDNNTTPIWAFYPPETPIRNLGDMAK